MDVLMQFSCSPQSYSQSVLYSSGYWRKPCCEKTQAMFSDFSVGFSALLKKKLIFGVNLRFRRLRFCLCTEQRWHRETQFTLWCTHSGRGYFNFFSQMPFDLQM